MLCAAAVPCLAIGIDKARGITAVEPTFNKTTTTTRTYSFNDAAKKEENDAILNDPAKYNGTKSFMEIYEIFREEIRTGVYNFGTEDASIGTPDSSWTVAPPEITQDHPRLLLTRDKIPTIRKSLEEVNPTNERFFELLDQPTSYINNGKLGTATANYDGRKGLHNYRKDYLEYIQVKALGYLVDGHELYGYQAVHCMKQFLRTLDIQYINTNMEREYGNTMFTAALVYDWCYDLLTEEDKRQLRAGIQNKTAKGNCGDPSYTTVTHYKWKMSVGYPPTNIGAVTGHASERQILRDYLSAAIAFYGDNNSWWDYIGRVFYSEYVPVRNYYFRSGISHQGIGVYVSGRHISDMYSAWMVQTATGTQPYENIDKTIRNFLGYECAPGKLFSDGDGTFSQQNNYEFRALAYMTAYIFADEPMLAQARDMQPEKAFGSDTIELTSAMYVALTGMSDIQPAADKYEGMPLIQYNGSPVGQYVTHEAWNDPNSAGVFMKIKERSTANHEHADAGNFMIYYKGMLTADAGVYSGYGSDHTRYYHQATVGHNSLLVDNGSQDSSSTDKKIKYYSGGQIWPAEAKSLTELKSETYHTGNVVGNRHAYYDAEKTQPHYAYIGGNISGAYDSETVEFAGRRMLVVYTGDETVPMVFFTYDRITSISGAAKKTFLFHITSPDAPTIVTSTKTMATENGGGRLVLTCLSDNVELNGIGGRTYGTDGKLDDSKSKNYYINGFGQVPINYDDGTWGRVEITNTQSGNVVSGKTTSFMNSMYVTDAGNTTYYATKSISNVSSNIASAGDAEGGVFNNSIAAVFVKKNIKDSSSFNSKSISFTTEGTDTLEYYVDGLAGGTWNVTVGGEHVTNATASNGLLTFKAAAGDVVLTKEASDVTSRKTELIEALGEKLAADDYTAASYSEYSAAHAAIVAKINDATSVSELDAIDLDGLKAEAEAKLVTNVEDKRQQLIVTLGEKISNADGTYTDVTYAAYSEAYDSILNDINSATTSAELNAIDVPVLRMAAEANLITVVDQKKEELLATLGSRLGGSIYTADSYEQYVQEYESIVSQINNATSMAALMAIDVPALKAAAEAKLEKLNANATITTPGGSVSTDLVLDYSNDSDVDYNKVYSVDIVWDDLDFTYNAGTMMWNPVTHSYDTPSKEPAWSDSDGRVTFTNHSNGKVAITLEAQKPAQANGTAELKVSANEFILESAVGTSVSEPPKKVADITASGVPESDASIGTLVVTIAAADDYIREGEYIYLGQYPQSLKDPDVTVGTTADSNGYFLGNDGNYYAKVVAAPYEAGYKFSDETTTVNAGNTYYFKVEPIKWRIVEEKDGEAALICESAILNRRFDDASNDYSASEVRDWLNNDFIANAFDSVQAAILVATQVDNSAATTADPTNSFACVNTTDKIYLLSYQEAAGFSDNALRMKPASDYAIANGTWITTNDVYYGNAFWLLRSPASDSASFVSYCDQYGDVNAGGVDLFSEYFGVVPAIRIKL